jgi:hypothetical protein
MNFYSISILILSILLLVIVCNYWRITRIRFNNPLNFDLIMYITSYKVIMYIFLPAVLRFTGNFTYDRLIDVEPHEILEVYLIEFSSYILWLLSITWCLNFFHYDNRRIGLSADEDAKKKIINEKSSFVLMALVCFFYIALYPYSLQQRIDINNGEALLIHPILMLIGPIIGIYIFSVANNLFLRFFLAGPVVILSIFGAFGGGSRGQIMAALLWFLFLYLFIKRRRELLVYSVVGAFLLVFSANLMTQIRGEEKIISGTFVENVSSMFEAVLRGSPDSSFLESVEFRFGEGGRKSVGFLRLVDNDQSAGLAVIESALLSFIPRRYFPEKPLLGSIDGTREGMGMHIIHIILENRPNIMSEFYTGVHAYWELSIIGVIIFSSISGFFISACIIYFKNLGPFGLCLLMALLKPPWLEPKLWTSELIANIFHVLLPLLFFWYLVKICVLLFYKIRFTKVD